MASYVPCKKNDAGGFIFYIGLVSQANPNICQSNPTIAAGDFKVSIDGGALANLGTLPAVTPAASKMVKITLAQAEINGDNITVVCSDAAGAEWCDQVINIQTAARFLDDHCFPTTSGRSLDVTATGAAGIDWANVENPTTAVNLSATNIDVDQVVASVSGAVGSVTAEVTANATKISGVAATADRLEAWINGFLTASTTGVPTASVFTSDATEATDDHFNHMILAFTGGALLGQARRISNYVGATKEFTVQPAFTEAPAAADTFIVVPIIVGGLDANGRIDLGTWLGVAPNALIAGRVDANAQAVGDKTGYSIASGGIISGAHAAAELNTIADAVLDRNMATGTDSGTDSTAVRTPRQALRVLRNKATIAAGTLTVRKEDDATASFTAAITTTAGNPISEVDPT